MWEHTKQLAADLSKKPAADTNVNRIIFELETIFKCAFVCLAEL